MTDNDAQVEILRKSKKRARFVAKMGIFGDRWNQLVSHQFFV